MLLGAHPELAVPFSPTGLWFRYFQDLECYGHLRQDSDRIRLVKDILQEERIRVWDTVPAFDDIWKRVNNCSYPGIIAAFHEYYADYHGKGCWALHDIATLYDMHIANQWFPEARFLHIVRDVRDVALSHKSYRYGSSNACEVALAWREAVGTNLMMSKMLGPERYQTVRFEDLICAPEESLEKICDFFGLRFDLHMLTYADDVDRKVPENKRSLWPVLGGAPDPSKIGRWRRGLKAYEVAAVNEITTDLMTEFGYDVDGQSRSFSKEAYLVFSTLSRGGRVRRLRQKLGI